MSTHKHIDKICCGVLILTILLTAFFVNAGKLGVVPVMAQAGYESGLFDTSRVHTIDIVMEEWDSFLDTCEDEEYVACSVVIDNEVFKNVGIRAKGNTSLSSVAAYGNDRYSFKIEFDCYESGKTYHGLDKLSLNNIIQDNTYMKDYLTYQMMGDFGVAAPLCSYAYITVNGQDWGLYLAVEGVEESFLSRNYGNNYGNLYKPDSMDMGGGRGNGREFDQENMERFLGGEGINGQDGAEAGMPEFSRDGAPGENIGNGEWPREGFSGGEMPGEGLEAGKPPEMPEDGADPFSGKVSEDGADPFSGKVPEDGADPFSGKVPEDGADPFSGKVPEGGGDSFSGKAPEDGEGSFSGRMRGEGGMPGIGGHGGGPGGSNDVALVYSDDEYDSYQNIFDNAKTDITSADKKRLIASLKTLGQGEDIESVVDIDAVIRYFVVHNFVCNFDSYTGSLIHNYYLYEKDGILSMIPWDYNLAFGGFENQADAASMVNYPIDSPVSGGELASRPMIAWIFASEEYTEKYHQYFGEFIDSYFSSGYFEEMISSVKEMIAPYVEKDPTKFCSYEEFETGIDTLREFCLLRAESIRGQLEGTIPSTSEEQVKDRTAFVDASQIVISDMGNMGHGMMGGGKGGWNKGE